VAGLVQSVDSLNTLLLAGGRGGGKSILLIWLIIYWALLTGGSFNGVLIRADLAGLQKLESLLLQHMPMMIPGSKYLKAKRRWQLATGGALQLIHMDGNDGFNKIQGEDLSHVFWDELGQEADPAVVLRVRSSMRTTDPSVQPKFVATANPLGPGSWWIRDYVVSKALPQRIFKCEFFGASETAWVKSTLRDNPYLANPDQYEAELKASCFGDESKIAAEVYGDWGQVTAGFFGSCLSIERSMLPGGLKLPYQGVSGGAMGLYDQARWCWIGADWGTASPACAVLAVEIVDDSVKIGSKTIPRGSWIAVDEAYVCSIQPDGSKEWNRGDRSLTTQKFAARVRALYAAYGMTFGDIPARRVIMDSAVTAQLGFGGWDDPVTLSSEFSRWGWNVTGSPKSSRAVGWQFMKQLLYGADTGEPGLYISEACESLWQTLPYCVSDDRNPEDMEKNAPDHSADSLRYILTAANQKQHNYKPPSASTVRSISRMVAG
jgi:hypothetical protein